MPRNPEATDFNEATLKRNPHLVETPTSKLSPLSHEQELKARAGAIALYKANPKIRLDMLEEPNYRQSNRPSLRIEVQKYAKQRGWKVFHVKDSRGSADGFPDLHMVRERVVYAELKRTGQKLKPKQIEYREILEEVGEEYYLWTPGDWEQIVETLW